MTHEIDRRWSELAPLLDGLLALSTTQREVWLVQHCHDDSLAALARELLAADARFGDALEGEVDALRDEDESADEPPLAPEIPGYRVLRFLGAGGMASVFLAERALAGAQQRVALKVLRLNVHDPRERAMFAREQQALARLEHTHIARLIDAGFAAGGTPWLATEYVDGDTLLRWSDSRRLDLRARATLFLDVCTAVAAAHQALVVHRDLKPANVLVTHEGTVKLVDFGIAKLLEGDEERTRTELRRLTPGYAAPEQFNGGAVGTAADIYALGVMLAELLSGKRPNPRRDGTVPTLSTQSVQAIDANARASDPVALRRALRGDLDAIVARALRPEPRQRYASVEALANDLRAWRDHRPVAARYGSRRYRVGKFIRRHALPLALGAAGALALLGATVVSLRLAYRAELAATQAREQTQRARRVQDFLLGMFRSDVSGAPSGQATSAEQLIERALGEARREFADQPDALVPLLTSLGEIDRGLGRLDRSRQVLDDAVRIAGRAFGQAHPLALSAEAELAHSAFRAGDYSAALKRLDGAIAAYRAGGGPENEALVSALSRLAMLEEQADRIDDALAHGAEAMQIGGRVFGGDHPTLQRVAEIQGGALANSGHLEEAHALLTENLAMARRIYGNEHIVLASALESLANVEIAQQRPARAKVLLIEAAHAADASTPRANVITAYVMNTLGRTELQLGETAAARRHFERAAAIYRALHGDEHPMLAATLDNLGSAALDADDATQALRHLRAAYDMVRHVRASTDFRIPSLGCAAGYAAALRADAEGSAMLSENLAALRGRDDIGEDNPMLLQCAAWNAAIAADRADWPRAAALGEEVLAAAGRNHLRDGNTVLHAGYALVRARFASGDAAAARDAFDRLLRDAPPPPLAQQAARDWRALAAVARKHGADDLAAAAVGRAVRLLAPTQVARE